VTTSCRKGRGGFRKNSLGLRERSVLVRAYIAVSILFRIFAANIILIQLLFDQFIFFDFQNPLINRANPGANCRMLPDFRASSPIQINEPSRQRNNCRNISRALHDTGHDYSEHQTLYIYVTIE